MQQTEEGTKTRKPLLTTECIMGASDDLFKTVNTDVDSQRLPTNVVKFMQKIIPVVYKMWCLKTNVN